MIVGSVYSRDSGETKKFMGQIKQLYNKIISSQKPLVNLIHPCNEVNLVN